MDELRYTSEQFACLGCDQTELILGTPEAPADEQARAKGWRCGITGSGDQHCYCPKCSGVNRNYWSQKATTLHTGRQFQHAWGWVR